VRVVQSSDGEWYHLEDGAAQYLVLYLDQSPGVGIIFMIQLSGIESAACDYHGRKYLQDFANKIAWSPEKFSDRRVDLETQARAQSAIEANEHAASNR